VLTLPDDKILVAGLFNLDGTNRCIVRLNANGTLDNTFTRASLSPNEGISSLAVQPDGKILVGGGFTTINGDSRKNIARLNPNGTVDNSSNPGTGPDRAVDAVALQPDGKVLIGGSFTNVNGTPRPRIARLNPDGTCRHQRRSNLRHCSHDGRPQVLSAQFAIAIGIVSGEQLRIASKRQLL
jgi:uncharacterized delta-60 repeat protein